MPRGSSKLQQLKVYARDRLQEEIREGKRGTSARIARKLGVSTAHVANLRNRNVLPGDDMLDRLGTYWGMTRDQMQSAALGEVPAPPSSDSQIKAAAAVHPVIARMAKASGCSTATAMVASLMVHDMEAVELPDDLASDLLVHARIALEAGAMLAASRLSGQRSDWRALSAPRKRKRTA
jgi:hypothetical protein